MKQRTFQILILLVTAALIAGCAESRRAGRGGNEGEGEGEGAEGEGEGAEGEGEGAEGEGAEGEGEGAEGEGEGGAEGEGEEQQRRSSSCQLTSGSPSADLSLLLVGLLLLGLRRRG